MEMVATTGAIRCAQLQSKCHHQQTNTQFFYRPDALLPNQQCQSTERRKHKAVNQQAVREAAKICPRPCKLTFDLLSLKVVPESRVTWATCVPILVFLGLSVVDLGPMYTTDRDVRRASSLNAPAMGAWA